MPRPWARFRASLIAHSAASAPDHEIPIESMRLKRIRDGREDYELLHHLAETGRATSTRCGAA